MITDDLFLELTWLPGKSPEDDNELFGLIEDLDQHSFSSGELLIEDTLPYVTFHQAELLFKELQRIYGRFQLEKIAVCHLEGKEAISEGEVFTSPFVIDEQYQNLLLALIQSILTERSFNSYSYQEKREYFENQVYPAYQDSVGVPTSALPLFPEEGESIGYVNPMSTKPRNPITSKSSPVNQNTTKVSSNKSLTKVYLLLGLIGVLALGAIGTSIATFNLLNQKTEQVSYLYQELKNTQHLLATKNQVDVFSRYFLPSYYSGKKEMLTEFLSNGDAKYTIPKEGTLHSVILEKMTYDSKSKEYQATYVLSVKKEEVTSNLRLQFTVKASDSAKYGFVVTTEPKESAYS